MAQTRVEPAHKVDLSRVVWGLAVIAAGVALWLHREGHIDLVDLSTWWPMIFIVIGVSCLFDRDSNAGYVWLALGGFFLLNNLGYATWPVLLIALGAAFLIWGLREGTST